MNPWNPAAGDTPAPTDAKDRALVERSARVIWVFSSLPLATGVPPLDVRRSGLLDAEPPLGDALGQLHDDRGGIQSACSDRFR